MSTSPSGDSSPSLSRHARLRLDAPSDLDATAVRHVVVALNDVLADVFALYVKTKNFHWHVSGPHFVTYHELLDGQATELLAMTDAVAERVRKLGATTLRSIGQVARTQRVLDNDAEFVAPNAMLVELCDDNFDLVRRLRLAHALCVAANDVASAGLIEVWVDAAERRVWVLRQTAQDAGDA